MRTPRHAFSEADRLLARPDEAAAAPAIAAADACWRNWRNQAITRHDGWVRVDHPIIARAFDEVQSATRLRLMLRDPLAFIWRHALGWRSLVEDEQPLSLDNRAYGELVHDLLKRSVDALEPDPGYARAACHEVEAALDAASSAIGAQWPLERSVPPALLWRHTLADARNLALKALMLDKPFGRDTRSWTELAFGREENDTDAAADLLWPPSSAVIIPGAGVRIRGKIDRLDFNRARNGVRVSDYKTGAVPPKAEEMVLPAVPSCSVCSMRSPRASSCRTIRRLLPGWCSFGDDQPKPYTLLDVDQAIAEIGAHVSAAGDLLRRGLILPGRDAREEWNDFRLALPVAPETYFQIKQAAFGRAFGDFARIWSAR